jgi:REP element-mobilizing transposase RayT
MEGIYVYFVTYTITDWLPVFINPEPIQIIVESMQFCIKEKDLRVNAYIIMPNHMYIIVFDAKFDNGCLQKTLADFRKFTGHRLANYIDNHMADTMAAVIRSKRLEDRDRQVWQPGWQAEGLASGEFWKQKMNYIHENPIRKGYVRRAEHWRFISRILADRRDWGYTCGQKCALGQRPVQTENEGDLRSKTGARSETGAN